MKLCIEFKSCVVCKSPCCSVTYELKKYCAFQQDLQLRIDGIQICVYGVIRDRIRGKSTSNMENVREDGRGGGSDDGGRKCNNDGFKPEVST